jgi:hypothetical protein
MEIWKEIAGFETYSVSSLGRVKRAVSGKRGQPPALLSLWVNNKGYPIASLFKDGKTHKRLVSRLVCTAFHGEPLPGQTDAAHNDGNPENNCAENVRWATRAENMADCARHGTLAKGSKHGRTTKPHKTPRGEKHGHSKLSTNDVLAIRNSKVFNGSGRLLAQKYKVSPATICLIRSRKIWSHI